MTHEHKWIRHFSGGSDRHGMIVCADLSCGQQVWDEEAFFRQDERRRTLESVRGMVNNKKYTELKPVKSQIERDAFNAALDAVIEGLKKI